MSAALDAAATVAIYVAWGIVILGGVIALAAFASRWGLPNLPRRREERPVEGTEEPPATTGSPDWAWPVRSPADAEVLFARRRIERAIDNGAVFGTASREHYVDQFGGEIRGPGSWDPDAFRGSLAERASDEVWTQIEIEEKS